MPSIADSASPRTGSISTGLLERAKTRDPEAWRRLVSLYGPFVLHLCRTSLPGAEDRADVFQEVFRAVALHLHDFRKDRPGDTFRGWLATITRNKIRDHARRQSGQPTASGGDASLQFLLEIPDPASSPVDHDPDASPNSEVVQQALQWIRGDFEPTTWQAFWRVVVEEHAPPDVASELGLTLNAVYKARARVLRRLREELAGLIDG